MIRACVFTACTSHFVVFFHERAQIVCTFFKRFSDINPMDVYFLSVCSSLFTSILCSLEGLP